jgi:EF hand
MTLIRLTLGIVSACCLMGAAGTAVAVTPAPAASMAKHDKDNDGSLSKDEYLALVEKLFKKADPDHDGTLDATELKSKSGTALRKLIG